MIKYYPELVQGSDEWYALRCGLLTASEMKLIITPATLKVASNEKERAHMYYLLAQRITRHVEPSYISDDMLRGKEDEIDARALYGKHCAPVKEIGFITNDKFGFTLGYSPDGLVEPNGAIECKGRRQLGHMQTLIENVCIDRGETVPTDYVIQLQTGMLVAELDWIDFITYCGGLPMAVIRVYPIPEVQQAIIHAAGEFEKRLQTKLAMYEQLLKSDARLIPTERRIEEEMHL